MNGVLATASAAAAGLAFRRVFGSDVLAPVVLTAGVTGTACTLVASFADRRRLVPAGVAVAAVTLVVVECGFAFRSGPSIDVVTAVVDGVINGWARILSSTLPVRDDARLVVVPVTATWLATVLAVFSAVRTTSPALPLLPGVLLFTLGLLLGVRGEGTAQMIVTPFLVAAASVFVYRARTSSSPTVDRTSAAPLGRRRAAALAVAVAGMAVLAAPVLAANDPVTDDRPQYDPREHRDDPVTDERVVSPLAAMRRELRAPRRVIFLADAPPSRWHLVTFDRYDERGWSSTATYRPGGSPLPLGDEPAASGLPIRQIVTLLDPLGPWLPAVDRPIDVRGVPFRFDEATGGLISTRRDLRNVTYSVVSTAAPPPVEVVAAGAAPGTDEHFLALPTALPAVLDQIRQEATAGADRPYLRMRALEAWFRAETTFDLEAPAGQSPPRLQQFFDTRRGTSEQVATAFAVLGRQAGVPTRVVVGFLPGDDVANVGAREVTNLHLHAWVEAHFSELGWISFDPTPERPDLAPEVIDRLREIQANEVEPEPDQEGEVPAGGTQAGQVPAPVREPREEGTSPRSVLALAVVALLIIAVAGPLLLRRRARRRRRRASDARARVVGAWDETVDALRWRGVPVHGSMSASEVVSAASPIASGADELADLARLVNAARFSTTDAPDATDADAAWATADRLAAAIRQGSSPRDRLRRAVDFGILVQR